MNPRRVAIITLVLAAPLLALGGCGFHLRGTGEAAGGTLPPVQLVAETAGAELARSLERALEQPAGDAVPWTLRLGRERQSRRVLSAGARARASEYEVRLGAEIELLDPAGAVVIAPLTIEATRIYTYDSSNVAGAEAEEAVLYREMRRDLVDRILRRARAATRGR